MSKSDAKPVLIDIDLSEKFGGPAVASYIPGSNRYAVIFEGSKTIGSEDLTLENIQTAQKLIDQGKHASAWGKLAYARN